jgi:hypothetical protein
MRNRQYLEALGKALGFESDVGFIVAAYAPQPEHWLDDRQGPQAELLAGPEGALIKIVRDWPEAHKWEVVEVVRAWDKTRDA